jgi:hypothetical protein
MEKLNEWEMSSCADGWLHRFKIVSESPEGVTEMCKLCTNTVFFPANCDNLTYLSYHLREALPTDHPLYWHEFPQGFKYNPKKTSY